MTHPDVAHWSRLGDPAYATGVQPDENLDDVRLWCEATGFDLKGRVLDIGCGTGRLARACEQYVGVDITPAFVDYCQAKGLDVSLIGGPDDLPDEKFDRITMLSVLTHIGPAERNAYLDWIDQHLEGEALLDISPGAYDAGHVGLWTVPVETFEQELADRGYHVLAVFDWNAAGGVPHRYYRIT